MTLLIFSQIVKHILIKQPKVLKKTQHIFEKYQLHYGFFNNGHNFSSLNRDDWDFIDLDPAIYDKVCSETLESLSDYFEQLIESSESLAQSDVQYNDGVLTVNFGEIYGTYVINRQTPNKQIWLSSPTSGPKRFDFLGSENADIGKWIYKHNGKSLHDLLQKEIKEILKTDVDFNQLSYAN